MGLGESANTITLATDQTSALRIVRAAAVEVGKITEDRPAVGRIVVKARFGLQAVKVRIQITSQEGVSLVTLSGFSDDVWGGGARKVMDRLVTAIASRAPKAPTQPVDQDVECPWCAEKIKAKARICKHCQRDVVVAE
jgi:hypothetical protein